MNKYAYITVLLISTLFILDGCRQSPDLQPELTGTWARTITIEGAAREGILTFTSEATFKFAFSDDEHGHDSTHGRYSQTDHKITFEGYACVDPGTYTFLAESDVLKFTLVSDDCQIRKEVLSGKWERVKK